MKKKTALLVCTSLMAALLAGCGSSEETAVDSTETVGAETAATSTASAEEKEHYDAKLVYVVANDTAPGIDAVQEELNKLTESELNISVELIPVTYGNMTTSVQLMLSSAEDVDIVPIGSGSAATYVGGEYLTDLGDYVEEYGQDIIDIVGMDAIETCRMGDVIWGIPNLKERYSPTGIIMRTDILEECGIDVSKIQSLEDLTEVFAAVHEKYPDMNVYGGTFMIASSLNDLDNLADRYGVLEDMGQSTTVTNYFESDAYKNAVKLAREWYLAGYTMKDMDVNKDSGETLMKAGNLFSYASYVKPNTEQEKENATGMDLTVVQIEKGVKRSSGTNGISYGISSASENPARAMELLNWIYKTEAANDLLNWGIEGIDWVETEDGTIDYPEGVTADTCAYHQNYGWAQINQFNSHVWKGNETDIWEKYEKFNNEAVVSVAYGFTPDLTEYSNELSAIKQVYDEYQKQLGSGVGDPEVLLDEFNSKLYDAGLQTIIDAKQEQLDAWLAEQQK